MGNTCPGGSSPGPVRRPGWADRRILRRTDEALSPSERIAAFEEANPEGLSRARSTLEEIRGSGSSSLATVSVALRLIRNVSQQGS